MIIPRSIDDGAVTLWPPLCLTGTSHRVGLLCPRRAYCLRPIILIVRPLQSVSPRAPANTAASCSNAATGSARRGRPRHHCNHDLPIFHRQSIPGWIGRSARITLAGRRRRSQCDKCPGRAGRHDAAGETRTWPSSGAGTIHRRLISLMAEGRPFSLRRGGWRAADLHHDAGFGSVLGCGREASRRAGNRHRRP